MYNDFALEAFLPKIRRTYEYTYIYSWVYTVTFSSFFLPNLIYHSSRVNRFFS